MSVIKTESESQEPTDRLKTSAHRVTHSIGRGICGGFMWS